MIKNKPIESLLRIKAITITISVLIVGLWIGGCTRAVYIVGEVTKFDSGNIRELGEVKKDIEVANDVRRQDSSRKLDYAATVDVTRKDLGNKDAGIKDIGMRDGGRKDIGIKDGGVVPGTWVTISAGTFIMGSPNGEACRKSNETQHQVTLTHKFEISTTEVTQEQFLAVRGYNPSNFTSCGNTCPVDSVGWNEAAAYCNGLSKIRGYSNCYDCSGATSNVNCSNNLSYINGEIYHCPGYRLPTEAEWEYAYRAGTTTSFHNNTNLINCTSSDNYANAISWNSYNSSNTTHPVKQKPANNWGLYDMAGNVWEWVNDQVDGQDYGTTAVTDPWGTGGTDRGLRGGSWGDNSGNTNIRAANRSYTFEEWINFRVGFRCVRTN